MLTQRTNILLDKDDYRLLTALAQKQEVSLGSLIRIAIAKTYKKTAVNKLEERKKNVLNIFKGWEKFKLKEVDYKFLVAYGRKY